MAHGFLSYEDSRGEKDYLGMLGKKLYSMAKNRPKGKKGSGDVELKKEGDEVKPQLTLPAAADTPALPGAERKALPGFKGSSIVPFKGSALSRVSTSTGPKAVTPEVMGGALTTITRKPGINAGSDVFDTTATRIADTEALQGIGDLIVRSNNNVVDALMGVQRVTVRVVDSVENLGRLQAAIAASEEQHREVLASRASAAAERAELGQTSDNSDFGKVKGLLKGGGGKGGGFVNMPGLGALARGAGGLVRGGARGIKGLAGRFAGRTAGKAAGKAGAKAGLKAGAKGLGKAFLKKIPLVGLGAGLLFAGQRAMAGDLTGAALELASGAAGTIPGFGTAASVGIDAALAGRDMGLTPFATGGIVTRPTAGLVGEQGREGVFPLEGSQGKKTFTKFGEGFLEAQVKNDKDSAKVQAQGLAQYYEKDGGAKVLGEAIVKAQEQEKKSGFWSRLFGGGKNETPPDATAALQSLHGSNNNTSPNSGLNGGNYTGRTKVGQNAPALSGVSIGLNSMLGGQPQFSSGFGYRNTGLAGASTNHMGHDYGVNPGAEQLAFESGTIVDMIKDFGGFGTGIVIQHEDGSANVYGHVKPMPGLKRGSKVNRGDKIGHYEKWVHPDYPLGRQHLHFERIPQYNPKDPRKGQIDPTSYLQALTPLEQNEINRDISDLTRGNRSTKDGEAGALGASGYTKGDRVNFMHNGQQYHGYRKESGWDLYKGTGIGATKLNMSQEVLQGSGPTHKHSSEVFGAFKEYLKANPGSNLQSNLYNPDLKTASLGNELYKSFDMTASLGGQFPTGATVINNYYNNGSSGSNEAQLAFGMTMNSSLGSGLTWNEAKEALT